MFLGRLNTKIKSDLCRIIRLLQFVYLRWEYSLTLVYFNKCQYIDNMINYTDQTVKTNIRLRGDLHFAFPRTVLGELDQPIAWEPQDAVGRCQQRPILRTRTARVRYGYPGWCYYLIMGGGPRLRTASQMGSHRLRFEAQITPKYALTLLIDVYTVQFYNILVQH